MPSNLQHQHEGVPGIKLLDNLNPRKTTCPDGVSACLLKQRASEVDGITTSGVSINVAGHEPPSLSVFGSALGLLECETRPLGDVVTPLQSWPPSSALALDHALK